MTNDPLKNMTIFASAMLLLVIVFVGFYYGLNPASP
jgi:hypothetical protein